MNQSEILTSEKVEEMKKENLQLRIKATTEATRSEVAALFNHQGLELTEEVLNVIAADTTQKILANARAIIDMLAVKKVDTEDNTAFAKKLQNIDSSMPPAYCKKTVGFIFNKKE